MEANGLLSIPVDGDTGSHFKTSFLFGDVRSVTEIPPNFCREKVILAWRKDLAI